MQNLEKVLAIENKSVDFGPRLRAGVQKTAPGAHPDA
jgi:hypothetical protein